MRFSFILAIIFAFACQAQNKSDEKAEIASEPKPSLAVENEPCNAEVCLQLRNHSPSNNSFEIYMVNNVSVAGFQCDLPGINNTGSDGGLLKEN